MEEPKLTDKEIVDTMRLGWDLMFNHARMISILPLEDWLTAMIRASTMGPLLDPTLWMKGHNKMETIQEMVEACLVVKKKFLELQQKVGPDGL